MTTNGKRKLKIDQAKIPRSYRDYLQLLADRGELVDIHDEVNWNLEMGAILRHACETTAAFPRFNNIRGAKGFRACEMGPTVSAAPGRKWQRLALMLGMPEDATLMEIQDAYMEVAFGPPHPPVYVEPDKAPCKQNKWFGDDIDLTRLPSPILHDGDGGRYFQTAGAIIATTPPGTQLPPGSYTYDPNSWTNWSFSRGMVASSRPNQATGIDPDFMTKWVFEDGVYYAKRQTCGLWLPFQHNGMIYTMWKDEGKDCPFVIALGMPPAAALQLSTAPPAWHDEYQYASALFGEGIELVKAETSDIMVPANCEIIIEGRVSRELTTAEGPFGEFPGYLSSSAGLQPTAEITCITFRDNAILPICIPGIPIDSTLMIGGFSLGTTSRQLFKEEQLPIIDCFIPFHAASHWLVIRAEKDWQETTGYSVEQFMDKIANVYWTAHVGKTTAKLFVVDHDVSPDDAEAVLAAFIARNEPMGGTFMYPQYDSDGTGLQIYLSVATKLKGRGGLVIYSCLTEPGKHARKLALPAPQDKPVPKCHLPILKCAMPFGPEANYFVVQVANDWHKQTGYTIAEFMDQIAGVFESAYEPIKPAKIFVFAEDIDPSKMDAVIWAFATRNNPVQGQYLYLEKGKPGITWQQWYDMPLLAARKNKVGMSIYSGLPIQQEINQPVEQVLSFETNYPQPLQQRVLDRWKKWGF